MLSQHPSPPTFTVLYSFTVKTERATTTFSRFFCSYSMDENWLLAIRHYYNRFGRQI